VPIVIVSENGDIMKLKRGQKLCKNCNKINGARAHVCKHCNTDFEVRSKNGKVVKKKKVKKYEPIDWEALQKGDRIKVIGRSGNYHINQSGEKTYLSDPGIYTVQSIDNNGILVYGNDNGFGYIYMGEEKPHKEIPNMYRSPHKIVKVNVPIRT
jgi:hypothetical protein